VGNYTTFFLDKEKKVAKKEVKGEKLNGSHIVKRKLLGEFINNPYYTKSAVARGGSPQKNFEG
jgi:hypothetical protein